MNKKYIEGIIDTLKCIRRRLNELYFDEKDYSSVEIYNIMANELEDCIEDLEDKYGG